MHLNQSVESKNQLNSWCLSPGTYIGYKVGSIYNTDYGIFFRSTKQMAQTFLNPYNISADKYYIKIQNPLISLNLKDAYRKMIYLVDQDMIDTINVNNIDRTRKTKINKLFILAKSLNYDALVYTGQSYDPYKRILCIFNSTQILKEY